MQLEEIMKEACEGHTAVMDANNRTKSGALAAGAALLRAKALVPHGEWNECIRKHFNASKRTAQRYMQIAQEVANGTIDPDDYDTLNEMEQAPRDRRAGEDHERRDGPGAGGGGWVMSAATPHGWDGPYPDHLLAGPKRFLYVWRLEDDENGSGPYNAWETVPSIHAAVTKHTEARGLPVAPLDLPFLPDVLEMPEWWVCGFRSPKQAREWFGDLLPMLLESGYVINQYAVPDFAVINCVSGLQLMFDKDLAIWLGDGSES